MTPLAHKIVKELTLPKRERTFIDQCGLLQAMHGVHCFDLTAVFDVVSDLAASHGDANLKTGVVDLMPAQAFLPFPKTWLEFRYADGTREGVLLEEASSEVPYAHTRWAGGGGRHDFLSLPNGGALALHGGTTRQDWPACRIEPGQEAVSGAGWMLWLWAALALINTPRLVGRRQHMPHAGLQKKLIANQKLIGKFPLHAWTEITLSMRDLMKAAGETDIEAHLTGDRALHWCRAHLRIRRGQLEVVRAHTRGNPALGFKRSRYLVTT